MKYKQSNEQQRDTQYKHEHSYGPTRQSLQRLFRFAVVVLEVCSANRKPLPQFFVNVEHDILRCLQRAGIDLSTGATPRISALQVFHRFYRQAGLPLSLTEFRAYLRRSRLHGGF